MNTCSIHYLTLLIVIISIFTLYYYNKKQNKNIIEGFSTFDNIKTILKVPFVILKFIVMILKIPCMIANFLESLIDKVL